MFIILLLIFTPVQLTVAAPLQSIVIVINTTDKNLVLNKQQIRHIYMGGALSNHFKPVHLPQGNPMRVDFNTKVVGLTESRMQAYWAQMKFTGRSSPPIELSSVDEVIDYLKRVDNAVAYLPAEIKLPDNLTIIELP